jgi:hypothetical protein
MKRLGIAAGAAVAAFMFTLLLTGLAGLASQYSALAPVQALLPEARVAEALIIRHIISPEIESTLELSLNQRHVAVAGHIHCTAGEQVRVDVTIRQEATGAQGIGHTRDFCTGEVQNWRAQAVARGPVKFALGPAQACAVAITRLKGKVTDDFSWCKAVLLAPE